MMAGAVVNRIVHHDQDGFTMRTFQIAGPGRVHLVRGLEAMWTA